MLRPKHGRQVRLGKNSFMLDLFLISLGDFGVVLGVNWLRTLGPISWDFEHMTMEFMFDGQPVLLQGIEGVGVTPNHLLAVYCAR